MRKVKDFLVFLLIVFILCFFAFFAATAQPIHLNTYRVDASISSNSDTLTIPNGSHLKYIKIGESGLYGIVLDSGDNLRAALIDMWRGDSYNSPIENTYYNIVWPDHNLHLFHGDETLHRRIPNDNWNNRIIYHCPDSLINDFQIISDADSCDKIYKWEILPSSKK